MRQSPEIQRLATVSLNTAVGTPAALEYANSRGGTISIASGLTSLTFHVSPTVGGTYRAAYDEFNVAVTMTVVSPGAYPIPAALFGAGAIKIVSNAAADVDITLKG